MLMFNVAKDAHISLFSIDSGQLDQKLPKTTFGPMDQKFI